VRKEQRRACSAITVQAATDREFDQRPDLLVEVPAIREAEGLPRLLDEGSAQCLCGR